jgi:YbgC/YbaW family acyl-CoA thioester hydrolase
MTAQIFKYSHRVIYAECTVGDHLYYGRYLDLLEAARGEFFRHLGAPFLEWQQADTILPVIECRLRYLAAAHYDDCLTVELWLTGLERVRLNFAYRVVNEAPTEILAASTLHACTSVSGKIKRLPGRLSRSLRPYLHLAAERSDANPG